MRETLEGGGSNESFLFLECPPTVQHASGWIGPAAFLLFTEKKSSDFEIYSIYTDTTIQCFSLIEIL
jgi:hypothetical protein